MNSSRREFFKISLLGSAVLFAGSAFSSIVLATSDKNSINNAHFTFLNSSDAEFLLALTPVILQTNYPHKLAESAGNRLLTAIELQIMSLDGHSQSKLRQLFDLLNSSTLRYFAGGPMTSWPNASFAEIDSFLFSWKNSVFTLKRTGYAALGKLITMSWYTQAENYQQAGYPGPPKIYPPQE